MPLSRRRFLRNMSMTGAAIRVGLPPLAAMFNSSGTAYAATGVDAAVQPRFVFWFNGNGIPERYWIPREIGVDYELTPCLAPLASVRDDVHVVSGIDNPNARVTAPGNTHHKSMSALVSGTPYTGRGAGGASIDQVIAGAMRGESRFRSLQVGVCQESHGENIHRNLSWAGADRALPPEMIPHNLFDRLFGVRDQSWISRKKSVLDAVRADLASLEPSLGQPDRHRLDEHLTSVREVERAIASLPSDYGKKIKEPEDVADLTDYPRIAKIQSDLVAHALASGQTRVVSYMLTKCQSLVRLPWLGYTRLRHHDYTHTNADSPEGQRTMRDICRWHVEEFAYFVAKLKSIPEGDRTLLDNTVLMYVHEHAEAGPHKTSGMIALVAGSKDKIAHGQHTKIAGTIGDLYMTLFDGVIGAGLGKVPTATRQLTEILT